MYRLVALLCVLTFSMGCDNPDIRKTSELEGFRILGIRTSPHVIELNANIERLTVEVIAFLPDDVTGYNWTLCASLGALARFECIPDSPSFSGQSSSSTWSIPFPQAALASLDAADAQTLGDGWTAPLCPDYELIQCDEAQQCPVGALCLEGACRSPTELYPVSFIVRVEPIVAGGNETPAALTVPILAGNSNNTSINATALKIGPLQTETVASDACANLILPERPKQPLAVSLFFDEASIDSFTRASDGVCLQQSELTTGSISWFATGATFQKSISDLDDPSNELELEADSEAFTVYGVIRDGRGSLDYMCAHVQIE
jgi:hypothetical protein